ncbi:reverse transcriptase [Plakobranchus ocellatus]|uniref:Reverse transcriptase n=1 Tax=Plakobranchus ocellatus TaxID=259542 RepID=A0AAV3Y7I9_9GAST|nr:reverse transcriptase [Plakobranchus ocellatus]
MGKEGDFTCPFCHGRQTSEHVLNSCKVALSQGPYTWRHNRVLQEIECKNDDDDVNDDDDDDDDGDNEEREGGGGEKKRRGRRRGESGGEKNYDDGESSI